jgi:DMSO/TMAO reductase YedYZ molybdopterin-dependent catalytic subunit
VSGLSPLITPNHEFYKIDTSLSTPQVDLATWTLRVHGMVERPYEITFADLMEMDLVERYVTLSCVSNEVGGNLVGNAKWLGVPLLEILDRARVQATAEQLVGRSVDGFTVGFPVAAAYDGRDALVAVGMNDEPLPFDHGFPARLVVAGLYGYVSATKWLSDIELTTWDGFDAYWVPRGWSKEGPIKTQSRIDTPRNRAALSTGARTIAGVAWAPDLGIERVEVQIDEGAWEVAELAATLDKDTWRQWRLAWSPSPGQHRIRVRATDAAGYTQTEEVSRPAPDGATGWHTIRVTVDA